MTAAKHTPGPWSFAEGTGFDYGSKSYGVRAPAPHHWVVPCLNLNPADCHLIAAAPDLLAALTRAAALLARDGKHDDAWRQARAAIAKATGESQ